jgi:hypothetical protein
MSCWLHFVGQDIEVTLNPAPLVLAPLPFAAFLGYEIRQHGSDFRCIGRHSPRPSKHTVVFQVAGLPNLAVCLASVQQLEVFFYQQHNAIVSIAPFPGTSKVLDCL